LQFQETRKFLKCENDVVHRRWDGTIRDFRKVCKLGLAWTGGIALSLTISWNEETKGAGYKLGAVKDLLWI